MKNYKPVYISLTILSLIFGFYNIFLAVKTYFNEKEDLPLKVCMIFACIGASAIFLNSFIIKYKEINNLPILLSRTIPLTLLIITVINLSVFHYILLDRGLLTGAQLYLQFFSLSLGIGVIIFLYSMMKNFNKSPSLLV